MAFAFVLEGGIDPAAFCAAWRRVVAASDALRTSIDVDGGGDRSTRVCGPDGCETTLLDFSGRADPAEPSSARGRGSGAPRPFPSTATLVDSVLVRLAEQPVRLVPQPAPPRHRRLINGAARSGRWPPNTRQPRRRRDPTRLACRWSRTTRPHGRSTSFPNPRARSEASQHWQQRLGLDRVHALLRPPTQARRRPAASGSRSRSTSRRRCG